MSQYEQDKDKEKEDESSSSSFQILQGGPSSSATAVAESEGGEGGSGSGIIGGTTTGAAQKRVQLATCYFVDERFKGNANPDPSQKKKVAKWRMKQRMKTVSVALVMCLNIGVDPPDVIKTSPCARLECWIDPFSQPSEKALDLIGKTLQQQYERWQPRARYKQCMDPTVEDVKKLCLSLRRNAKEERVLFHYNGHGVPRPTSNGELWVFNKNFTQYIPLSIYELQTWMGSPSIYIFDCSSAGLILQWFNQFAEQREHEQQRRGVTNLAIKDYILLAACGADELLPMNPELPQDVFTACLTTPIKIALQWFCSHSIVKGVTPAMVDKLPGRLNDRKTPLGELNWIFTAVTDTIAWNVLPRDLFQKLFRQDLLVASLFRNFLLAERIMRSANCNPTSWPVLPPTYQHPMWQAWDLAADVCLSQLPKLLQDPNAEFQPNPFFAEQLTAFEVWLEFASEKKRPPEQLPIVLQVLLSQAHRLRALVLLSKFLDAGPWAVNLALSVGIFPYVLKLLQSPAVELRQTLVFIWAKILALDKSCQLDLVKDNGHNYFISVLDASNVSSELRTMAAFVLTVITDNCRPGQSACLSGNLIPICLAHLPDADPLLRRWLCLCLGKLWQQYDEAKRVAIKENAHKRLCALLTDPIPEVRAAAVYALGTFMGGTGKEQAEIELNLVVTLPVVTADASAMVRKELVITLSRLVQIYEEECKEVAVDILQELVRRRQAELQESEAKAAAKGSRKGKKSSIIIGSITAPKKKGSRLDIATSTSRRRSSSSAPTSASTSPSDIHSDSSLASSSVSSEEMDPSTASSTPTSHHHGGEGTDSSRTRSFHRGHQRQLSKQQSSVYGCLWKMVLSLESDPFPEVARLAGVLVESVHHQLDANLVRTANSLSSSSSTASSSVMSNSITIGDGDGASGSSPQSTTSSPSFSSSLPHQLKAKAASVSNVGFIRRYAPSTSNLLGLASPKPASQGSKRKSGDGTSVSPPDHGASSSLSSSPNGSSPGGSGAGDAASTSSSSSLSAIAGEHGLELESVFYAWSCQYFSQPCLRSSDGEDITSPAYSRRLWRHQRHKALLSRAKLSRERGIVPRMEEQIAIMDNRTEMTSLVMFHPLETFVIVSDNKDDISVWDWTVSGGKRQHRFSNTNAAGSRITDMKLCNPHDNAILLTATDDGVMRVWRGFDDAESVELVTAWKALPELASSTSNNGAGMIIEWRQQQGALLTSGDVGIIHVWDVERELATHSFATNGDTCVTSMASHGGAGHVLVAGFGDGAVKLFDCRMSQGSRSSLIASFHEHKKWVVNTAITYVENQILSGSTAGEIKFWDTRKPTSYKTITAELAYMSSFSVHPFAPVIACGSNEQKIQILDMNGSLLHEIKYHEGFLGQRIGPISCLAFHPYETLLAAGATDSIISVYSA